MSRQDKATTDRNARTLRELVKQPDNKACADCRTNDARWASWNLGVFLCIRCSGIHRSMGTHISKVKSIDLDVWTPEQMESVQKWGNVRANLYWEAHLKKGHVPPDHKIESFIRSKYESRRWALEGPPPRDPSILDGSQPAASASPAAANPPPAAPGARPTATGTFAPPPRAGAVPAPRGGHPLLSRNSGSKAPPAQAAPIVDLFGDDEPAPAAPTAAPTAAAAAAPTQATTAAAAPAPTATATATAAPPSNIFDLDFKAPAAQSAKPQTAKADIMSLFSQQPAAPAATGGFFAATSPIQNNQFGSWNGGVTSSQPPVAQATQSPVPTWGGFNDQAAWGAPASSQQQQQQQHQQPQQTQQPQQQQFQSNNNNLWGAPAADPWVTPAQAAPAAKKEERDPFANIWG